MRKGASILVVEDEPMVRDSMERVLRFLGCTVVSADNGLAALELMSKRPFDIVLTDFSMPGMSGDTLVVRIRERFPHQRIIMVTAFVEEYKVFGENSARVDALLLKPFSVTELQDAIERFLEPEPGHDIIPPKADPEHRDDLPPPHKV